MVEAMAAELERQAGNQRDGGWVREPDGEPGFYLQGTFDLEKVARAGLAAAQPSAEIVNDIADPHAGLDRSTVEYVWDRVRDAILKGQP
jgi:hypothetical protein